MTHLDKYLPHADTPTPKPAEGKWVLIGPNNETFLGTSPIDCLRQEQKLRVPPEVALGRIARMLGAAMTFDEWWDTTKPAATPETWSGWERSCRQAWDAATKAERERCALICDTTPPYPFRPSIEAAHAIRTPAKDAIPKEKP